MLVCGKFEIDLTPEEDAGHPAGRMLLQKTYLGDMSGTGVGQMISKRTESGAAVYSAIEEFTGTVDGKKGAFTLFHVGRMNSEEQSSEIIIVESSGTGELENISGTLLITQDADGHSYELTYVLN